METTFQSTGRAILKDTLQGFSAKRNRGGGKEPVKMILWFKLRKRVPDYVGKEKKLVSLKKLTGEKGERRITASQKGSDTSSCSAK